ncbi:MAG: DUF5684 domain-containing protein [Anaeromyxobacter sp.]
MEGLREGRQAGLGRHRPDLQPDRDARRSPGSPIWWVILLLIPIVGFVVAILVSIEFAKAYGKGAGFGLGLVFLGFIFIPILGFGSAQYQGDGAAASARAA